jgi:hypothetical protein
MKTARFGIIGGGFGALLAYTVLRFRGVPSEDIVVFSADASPELSWERFVRRINQKYLRSESIAHFFPTDSPGLATVEAVKTWSLKPIILSWFDLYHPTVDFMVNHVQAIARQVGFYQSLKLCRIGRVAKETNGFTMYDTAGQVCGSTQHIIMAIGHGELSLPPVIEKFKKHYAGDTRVRHVFEDGPVPLRSKTTLVLGAGLTAGTEWYNGLMAGGRVVAISPEGFTFGQPLNTPRRYFSRRGIKPFAYQPTATRLNELKQATRGTVPSYRMWNKAFREGHQTGRLEFITGWLESIEPAGEQLRCMVRETNSHTVHPVMVDQVLVTTGFKPAITHPVLRQLITDYTLPVIDNFLEIDANCRIAKLSTPESVATVIGPAAAWQIPCADSIGGMKIAAHRLAEALVGAEGWQASELYHKMTQWARLIRGKSVR